MTTDTFTWSRPKEIIRRRIPLGLIDVPPEYERVDSLVEDDALRRSIEKSGVQQPIIVLPVNGRFTLVKGTRRLAVSILAKFKDIPAIIDTPPQGVEIETYRNRLRFVLTHARQDLSPSQRCNLIKQMMKLFGLNQKMIAAYLGVDAGSVTNWLAIGRYIEPVVQAIDSGDVTLFSARALDGVTPEGQAKIFRSHRKEMRDLSGGRFHRLIRSEYPPAKFPTLYVSPEKTLEKLQRTKKGRTARARPKLSRDEKRTLSRDLEMRETELADSKEELQTLKREIALASQPINAILRNKDLSAMLSDDMREEFERFTEVY